MILKEETGGLEKVRPSANLLTTHPTQKALGANPGFCGQKTITNRLYYRTAKSVKLTLHLPDRYEYPTKLKNRLSRQNYIKFHHG